MERREFLKKVGLLGASGIAGAVGLSMLGGKPKESEPLEFVVSGQVLTPEYINSIVDRINTIEKQNQ